MRRPVGGVGDAGTPQDWFRDIPIVTKILLISTVGTAALASFKLLNPMVFIFHWDSIYSKFEIWRFFTAFMFAGTFSFPFLMHTYMLYQNSVRYEANPFNTGARGTSADYLWMILFTMIPICILSHLFGLIILAEPLLYVIMYVWSRREPEAQANIFGFKFQASYLPWVYVAIRMLMGNSIVGPLIGIAAGHLYYFLVDVLPASHGYNLIQTPEFCISFVEWTTGFTHPANITAVPSAGRRPAGGEAPHGNAGVFPRGGYNWGSGRVLGTNGN
jgi:Derlin-2/3